MKRYKAILALLILLILVLGVIRVGISNRISTGGVELGTIEDEISFYRTQNLIYKEKIYTLSSLNHISSEAAKVGFVDSKASLAIGSSLPIAAR